MEQLQGFADALLALVPVVAFGAPLISVIVDTAKRAGLKDGAAPLLSGVLNLALYALVFFAGDTRKGEVESVVQALTLVAPIVAGYFVSLLSTAQAHELLAKIGIGFKNSQREKPVNAPQPVGVG